MGSPIYPIIFRWRTSQEKEKEEAGIDFAPYNTAETHPSESFDGKSVAGHRSYSTDTDHWRSLDLSLFEEQYTMQSAASSGAHT